MTVSREFDETIAWLEDLHTRPHVPAATAGLRRAEFLLAQLDNPHRAFRSVHVAGSTGKGSTTTMIGSVLQAAGNQTGYFRSPHLETYRERIAINEVPIDESSWIRYFKQVADVSGDMERGVFAAYDLGRPTVFEVLFAMAALFFRDTGVAWAAIETGMGGRLDATNTLASDVAVVTNISLEHTRVLGSTVEEIAVEKAAIIKSGCDAVTTTRDGTVREILAKRSAAQGVRLRCLGEDFEVETLARDREWVAGETLRLVGNARRSPPDGRRLPGAKCGGRVWSCSGAATAWRLLDRSGDSTRVRRGPGTRTLRGPFDLATRGARRRAQSSGHGRTRKVAALAFSGSTNGPPVRGPGRQGRGCHGYGDSRGG